MSFSRYIAFSIVASSVLCGAQNYTDWNNTTFQDGDSVTITNDVFSTKPISLTHDVNITSGKLNANITNSSVALQGIVAQLGKNTTFGGNGEIIFNVNVLKSAQNAAYFDITNGGLTVSSAITVNASGQTVSGGIFRAQGNATLTFSDNTTINGNGNTAITMGSGQLDINQSGGKKVAITGAISSNGGTTNIKLDSNDDTINGAITATGGTTRLELSNGGQINGAITANSGSTTLNLSSGSQITGNFTGNGNSNLTLSINGSTFNGSVSNNGSNNITINNGGKIQGDLTTTGNPLALTLNNGTITGSVSAKSNGENKLTIQGSGGTLGSLRMEGTKNTINYNDWTTSFIVQQDTTLIGKNILSFNGRGTFQGTLTTQGDTDITTYNSSSFKKIVHSNGSYAQKFFSNTIVSEGITTTNASSVDITVNGGKINGTSLFHANGNVNLTFENNSTGGDLTLKGNTNTLKGTGSNTLNSVSMIGQTNTLTATKSNNSTGKITITTDVSMNGNNTLQTTNDGTMSIGGNVTLSGTNAVNLKNSTISGNATLSGQNTITLNDTRINGTLSTTENGNLTNLTATGSTINKIEHSNSQFQANLTDTTINQGITVNNGAKLALVTATGNTQINGDSFFNASITGNQVVLKDNASGGNFNFGGSSRNNLFAYGTNTIQNLTMTGVNGGSNTNNNVLVHGTSLTINQNVSINGSTNQLGTMTSNSSLIIRGNATLSATTKNVVSLGNGTINGTLTTEGLTSITTGLVGNAKIDGGIRHSNGNIGATFGTDSEVSNGIITEGKQGAANITFNNNSKLNGDSSFDNATNQVTLNTSAQVNGNLSFNGGSTLTANNNTSITGQVITNDGRANYGFNDSATVTGGIDTEAGATSTTANFNGSSILKDGTSTFHSDINITFAGSSKATNETFNVQAGTANIIFKDNAEMQSGSITNNGGDANITFTNNAQMNIAQGGTTATITTNSGNTVLTANSSADLTGALNQAGGNFNATFSTDSTFTGNATQSGGISNITFNGDHQTTKANWTGNFSQTGSTSDSTITFDGTAKMLGNIQVDAGSTNITFNANTGIAGDILARGETNNVTFTSATLAGNLTLDGLGGIDGNSTVHLTNSTITDNPQTPGAIEGNIQGYDKVDIEINNTQVSGFLHQGGSYHNQAMNAIITNSSVISGGFEGYGSSNNTLTITDSTINNGVKQSTGTLKVIASEATITDGFQGSNNSNNNVDMLKGNLSGGIQQNTGSLDFKSQMTDISGGFTGMNSTNTLKMANGDFGSGKISQVLGSVQGEIIMMSNLGDFGGESSQNILHLSSSKIKNVVQSSGSLELNTNADVEGKITGDRASENKITITGANVLGEISQNLGSMDLTLLNSNAKKTITSTNADFGLYATNATVEGDIGLIGSASNGVSDGLTLNGKFTQSNGTSTMTFSNTNFMKTTTISNAVSASLIFSRSTIQDIEATQGITAYNLSDSSMQGFTGNMGQHSITLVKSNATTFSQKGGSIILNASNSSQAQSVTGINFSNVAITLDRSHITADVTNNGETTIAMQDSDIGGNVKQTGSSLSFTASNSILTGQYKQTDGTSMVNFMNSKILGGIDLLTLGNGTMNFTQGSQISNGVNAVNSRFTFMLLSNSTLDDGFTQNQGQVTGTVDESTLNGGMILSNGSTNFSFYNGSVLNGDIKATDHNTTILIDRSTINGNMTIKGGSFDLTAQNGSTVNGANGGANNKSQVQITNADFKLTLDTGSTFNGDISQTNNNQTIIVKQNSNLNGNITNTDVTSSISVNNATIGGSISQTRGSLALDLSNNGKVNGDITLTNSNTTLSGSGTGNQIGGNFSQNNGTLGGSMTGLTLNGTFEQTGGTSNVSFFNSEFQNNTTITNATSSSLTFDNSTLKGYTTSGGLNNTLKLLNNSTMNGTLTLTNGALTTLTMENSTLNGDNGLAINASDASFLTFNTKDSTINGDVKANTGGVRGNTDNTDITGNISLTDTISDVSFTNTSTITGNLTATGTNSNNTINFDNSSITGNVSQEGGAINLDLSNGSSIGQNLTFTNATARLTGSGAGNSIGGNLDSNNTTLTGDASGLNLKGTFTQTNGSSDIIFRNDSLFEDKMTLDQGTSDIKFVDNSGIRSEIEIKNQTKASVGLQGNSFIEGNISVSGTNPATLSAQNNSTITGDITLDNSTTNLNLSNQSSLKGGISQTAGILSISASGRSTLTSDLTLENGATNITLADGSNLTGTITANENPLSFTLRDNSSYNNLNAPQNISVTNADLTISASNNSVFGGNLTHISDNGGNHSANLTFNSNSFYSGTMSFGNVTVSAKFNQSGIFSNGIEITGKSALFDFDGATNGGVIQSLAATNTNLTINTANQSHITINDLQINGNALNLKATNSSRLTANVTLNNQTIATYTANTNGNLNVNTKIANQASTLTVDINGGMMQGAITQDPNGNNGFPNGEVTLSNGGRWAVTDDTQAKELTLTNTEEQLYSDAIFASAFNSPLSFVDFTLDFADEDTTSRVGKAIIQKPQPQPNQPIPPAPDGSTYVRQLHLNEIKGNNGLFRVYADLGTNLADNILASKASGDHLIQVQYRAETFREIGGDRIVVAKVTDPSTTVSFKGTQSEIGLTKYDTEILKENAQDGQGFEWIIGQATPAGMSYSSKIIASILQSQYRTFAIEIDSLDRRMGDLEFIKRDKGFWIRSFIGSNTKEATDYSTLATDNYYSIWSGFDYNSIGLTVHNYVGVFFNYTGINTESKDYTGKSSNIAFGFYNTFKAFSGFYADILAKYIYTMSEFDISNYSLAKNSPKIDNHKFLLNAEIGYSFYYGEKGKSGYIQPQFQVTSGYIHKTDLSVVDVSGETINATIGRNFPVSIRAGAFWGQVFGEKIKSHIKLGTSFVYDVDSGGVLNFSDSSTELQFKQGSDFRWVLSAATDFTFSEFFKLYASFDTSFFGNYNTTYSANLGIRFTFGRANNYVRNVPMVYSPYTPPVSIDNDKRTVPVVKRYTTKDIDQNYVGKPRRVESYIQGNSNPTIQQGSPTYTPSRQSHRDITSEVEF